MDNFIVSARKYRPITFDTVVGQQHITSTLKNAIKNKQLAQAFLFCGPRGVGKTTCARILAKTINCLHCTDESEACGECESCKAFQNGNSFSVHELDAASNNSVDDIRSLIEQVRIPPQTGKYKVYIIDEVHMLSQAAFNAFLKTLEEPPSYAIFILATTEKHKILPTILSRCQIFDFNRIKVDDIAKQLEEIANREGVVYDLNGLHLIAQKSDGGMRDALSMFDQLVSFSNKNVSYQAVIDNLNVLDYDYYFKIGKAIVDEDAVQALLVFDEVLGKGFDGSHFIAGLADHFRDLLMAKDGKTVKLLEVSQNIRERYLAQSEGMNTGLLLSALAIANQCEVSYKNSRNQRLQVELALLKMCHISTAIQLSDHPSVQAADEIVSDKKKRPDSAITSPPPYSKTAAVASDKTAEPIGHTNKEAEVKHGEKEEVPVKVVIPKLGDISVSPSIPSLNSVFEEATDQEADAPTYLTGTGKQDFSEAAFMACWNAYAEQAKASNKISLYTLMTANPPKLLAEGKVEVVVENIVQQHLLANEKIEILNFIRVKLDHFGIDLFPVMQMNTIPRKPITDKEKYQAMIAKNPLLDKLRQEFNLGFE